jgi:hypothetical protein
MTTQTIEGQGTVPAHTHEPRTHIHDHYHVSHHHSGGMLSEWEHRTYWHTHDHNHNELAHSHDYSVEDEERHHAKESHIHDHAAPARAPEHNNGGAAKRYG